MNDAAVKAARRFFGTEPWWMENMVKAIVAAAVQERIELNEGMVLWTENNFISGPNTKAAIHEYEYAIEQLKIVRDGDPDE